MHRSRIVHRESERTAPQRSGKRWEQEWRRRLVVPHVRAVAVAASARVVAALEAVKFAVRSSKAGGCGERGQVRARGLLHCGRNRARTHRFGKRARARFEILQMLRGVAHRIPPALESLRIVIADDRLLLSRRRRPSAPFRCSIRKTPAQEEFEILRLARLNRLLHTQHTDLVMRIRRASHASRLRKLIPEQQWRVPPSAERPSFPVRDLSVGASPRCHDEVSCHRIFGRQVRIAHQKANHPIARAVFIAPPVVHLPRSCVAVVQLLRSHRVVDRKRNPHLGFRMARG